VAIAEMRYMGEGRGDYKQIINAAVEIARAYVGDSAARFINGVLGTVASRYPAS
jgi:transcription termination factor NusB